MAPVYSYVQFAPARQELANRLYDPNKVFWSDSELKLIITEALRTWNALTGFWRGDFLFSTSQGVSFYDMTNLGTMPNSLVPFTVHDTDIYTLLQLHLLEPVAWSPWTGVSAQFTDDDLLNAVARRRDEILSITGCTITRSLVPAVNGRIVLADSIIDVRRMAYLPAIGSPSVMWPEDTWAEQAFNRNYLQNPPGTPFTYMLSTEPPLSFDTDAPPGAAGSYEVLSVNAGGTLTIPTPSLIPIPDDWTPILKWGALADLLSRESNSKDPLRAQYAEQRYRMGLSLLSKAPALLALRVGNVPLQVDSIRDADCFNTGWEAAAQAAPGIALYAGLNLLAFSPPDSNGGNNYSMTVTTVIPAPLPVADTDPVQMARDDYDVVLDYCVHLAMFKAGGAEFSSTIPLFERFMKQAANYGLKLQELGEFTEPLYALSHREDAMNPRLAGDAQ